MLWIIGKERTMGLMENKYLPIKRSTYGASLAALSMAIMAITRNSQSINLTQQTLGLAVFLFICNSLLSFVQTIYSENHVLWKGVVLTYIAGLLCLLLAAWVPFF
jgi:hypothetical protein